MAFKTMVVNCTAGMECKSQMIDDVVAATEKYLGVGNFTAKALMFLNYSVPSSQTAGLK